MTNKELHRISSMQEEVEDIHWSSIIFLPFHPVFKLFVLSSVIFKCVYGPLISIYPALLCSRVFEELYMSLLRFHYLYLTDLIYIIDTFLHIVHRQVTDLAMRREHLPKSAFLLMLDIIALIPFYRLVSSEKCPVTVNLPIYPNILSFTEVLVIYRVAGYFSLASTHSFCYLWIGFILFMLLMFNCLTCFLILITKHGLCKSCTKGIYDWRSFVIHRLKKKEEDLSIYIFGTSFVSTFFVFKSLDEIKSLTMWGYAVTIILMVAGHLLCIVVIVPKLFAESLLRIRRICTFHTRVSRIINETKRRNPSPTAHKSVEKFYSLIWNKRSGINSMPEIISALPRYLRIDIRQDLFWPVFYHSPTFRNTSQSYKRWLCDHIRIDYKLPGERFYGGPHCFTNLYYLKSGIVQVISSDDSSTGLVSMTDGTVFGDTSFFTPPLRRKVIARCHTFCEVLIVSRADILKSLHKFPDDRRIIMAKARERMTHARALFSCKQENKSLDRSETESIAWVKRRWWQISDLFARAKRATKKERKKFLIPPEETPYHCAKYIGQLVLCSDLQLQSKSMFANVELPFILQPYSNFIQYWQTLIMITIYFVLVLFPPNISHSHFTPGWFIFFQFAVDLLYSIDILVSLITALHNQENLNPSFAAVMFARCKSFHFHLDILCTPWPEHITVLIGKPEFYNLCKFNRLLKTYRLFSEKYRMNWTKNDNPTKNVCLVIALLHISLTYVGSHFFYLLHQNIPNLSTECFFGEFVCSNKSKEWKDCDPSENRILNVALGWTFERIFAEYPTRTLLDVVVMMVFTFVYYLLYIYTWARLLAALYLKYREPTNYHYYVTNLKKHYVHHKIHPDLLKRLDKYLECHWKYFKGMDITRPNILKDEPYDIYWKLHGEVAERIIGQSRAFEGASPALVRDLAQGAKYLMLPKSSTLFLFGVKCQNVTWIVNGVVKCEYHNEKGELLKTTYTPGQVLSVSSVFFGKAALKTYVCATECEVLYMSVKTFFTILKRYSTEWSTIETCLREFEPKIDEVFESYLRKHRDYQKKLRERIFHARQSVANFGAIKQEKTSRLTAESKTFNHYWGNPNMRFARFWIVFRIVIVVVSIAASALKGGSGAIIRKYLEYISRFCDVVAYVDILMKFYMPYYDKRGLLISDFRKCFVHYLSRSFICDVIGAFPLYEIYFALVNHAYNDDAVLCFHTVTKFAHVYILTGYFNYLADVPSTMSAFFLIFKWQLVSILIQIVSAQYFMAQCVDFHWNKSNYELVDVSLIEGCWAPNYHQIYKKPSMHQIHTLYAESLHLAQNGLIRSSYGKYHVNNKHLGLTITYISIGLIFWYILCFAQSLQILSYRGSSVLEHGVHQLKTFLKAERVDKDVIKRAINHFNYWWTRTRGLNEQSLMSDRIGVVFKQDLNYYFFKKTFMALDTLLSGGDTLERQLAGVITQMYLLPGEEIVREMDLVNFVYVVHRGKVLITRGDEKLAVLTKGAIFGQLQSKTVRPSRISARADEYVDLLQIPIKLFQENINDEIREKITANPQSENDYMALKKIVRENPYNTVEYLLRGRKTIQLPWMIEAVEGRNSAWYSRWLFISWLVGPILAAFLYFAVRSLPQRYRRMLLWPLLATDAVHLIHFIIEFYTMELVVEDNKCVYKYIKLRRLTQLGFYFDLLSLLVPFLSVVTGSLDFQVFRLLRMHLFYLYHKLFCKNFQMKTTTFFMKFSMVLLLFHILTCEWIMVACRGQTFTTPNPPLPAEANASVDWDVWALPFTHRKTELGCPRITKSFILDGKIQNGFVVSKYARLDYIVALINIMVIHTRINMLIVVPLTVGQIYYKMFANIILYLFELWISSILVSAIYNKYWELYQYDYEVANLITYLKRNDLSFTLLEAVQKYTSQLWSRQKGNCLPDITLQAPVCLREDIFSALYMHHLQTPSLFRQLPDYFLRQLVERLRRVVIFPGKTVVEEGDIFSVIYFIHEGEVEKWYTDKSGVSKMASLLSTNGYFGLIPGLFPNTPYQFSYITRTVVDFVYLRFRDWQDILDGYPEVKFNLYNAARKTKKDIMGKWV